MSEHGTQGSLRQFRFLVWGSCIIALGVAGFLVAPGVGRVEEICRQEFAAGRASQAQLSRALTDERCPAALQARILIELASRRPLRPDGREALAAWLRGLPLPAKWDAFSSNTEAWTWIPREQNRLLQRLIETLQAQPDSSIEELLQDLSSDPVLDARLRIFVAGGFFDYMARYRTVSPVFPFLVEALGTERNATSGPSAWIASCLPDRSSPDPFREDSVCHLGIRLVGSPELVALLRDALHLTLERDASEQVLNGLASLCEVQQARYGRAAAGEAVERPPQLCGPSDYLRARDALWTTPWVDPASVQRFEDAFAWATYRDYPEGDARARVPLSWLLEQRREQLGFEGVVSGLVGRLGPGVLGPDAPALRFQDTNGDGLVGRDELLRYDEERPDRAGRMLGWAAWSRMCDEASASGVRCQR